ncbi:MAG: hypothetical protein NVSMB13_00510 [Mycobacteriales bacterium]
MLRQLLLGAAAGAAGTTALNAASYADMTYRARPASSTPEKTVEEIAGRAHLDIPGEGEGKENRVSALGALSGILTGVGVGAAYGAARALGLRPPLWAGVLLTTAGALAGSDGPMTLLGITDPRTWSAVDWASDVVPHLAYGAVTAATYAAGES